MSSFFQIIVDTEVSEADAPAMAHAMLQWLIGESIVLPDKTDCAIGCDGGYPAGPRFARAISSEDVRYFHPSSAGLGITCERTFFPHFTAAYALICPACDARFDGEAFHQNIGVVLDEWQERHGPANLSCPKCGQDCPISQWQSNPAWGFGNLGFEFWDWPPLTDEFIAEFQRRLQHKIVVVADKL